MKMTETTSVKINSFVILFVSCSSGWPRMGRIAKDNLDS